MNAIADLNRFYFNAAKVGANLVTAPYVTTFISSGGSNANFNPLQAVLVCALLTPILAPVTALACGIAITGGFVLGLSAIIAYPTAMCINGTDGNAPRIF
jgi:hypothetical protein